MPRRVRATVELPRLGAGGGCGSKPLDSGDWSGLLSRVALWREQARKSSPPPRSRQGRVNGLALLF